MTFRNRRRKAVNGIMLGLCAACAFLTVSTLFVILGFLVYNGISSLSLNFFTRLPLPPGKTGGGMANAIVGSAQIVAMATVIGLPIGFFTGVYLAEYGGKTMAFLVRYVADLLNGIPSIVIGIFAWTVIVVPQHHFSAFAGSVALSLMLIPITARSSKCRAPCARARWPWARISGAPSPASSFPPPAEAL
jgi:phosphate transport system permease protein